MNALLESRRSTTQVYTVFYAGEDFDVHYMLEGRYSPGDRETPPEYPRVIIECVTFCGNEIPLAALCDSFMEESENAIFEHETAEEGEDRG